MVTDRIKRVTDKSEIEFIQSNIDTTNDEIIFWNFHEFVMTNNICREKIEKCLK